MLFLGKTNRDFKHNKLWGFIIILGLLLAFLYGIWLYNDDNRYVTWDDDTVGWIIAQEVEYSYHAYPRIRINELPDIRELNLDAELIRSIKVLKYFKNLEKLVINAKILRT